jgi:hypothetical protein
MTRRLDGQLFAEDDSWSDRSYRLVLLCPECGGTYSHIRRVGTLLGADATEASIPVPRRSEPPACAGAR